MTDRSVYDEPLEPEEFDRRLAEALADQERQAERDALITWFMRRYPSVRERLAYVRRKTREWQRRPDRG